MHCSVQNCEQMTGIVEGKVRGGLWGYRRKSFHEGNEEITPFFGEI